MNDYDYNDMLTRYKINLDITHRCPLECLCCQRWSSYTKFGLKVPGEDLPYEDFIKIANHFDHLNFCGQVSDPVHHPKFIEFLEYANKNNNSVSVHHASGAKPESWYEKAFKANPRARWVFGIDGLPHESNKYRVNQDGEKLYRMMKLARKFIDKKNVIWQMIVFSYNENKIDEVMQMATEADVMFMTLISSRWRYPNDWLKPKNNELSLDLYKEKEKQVLRDLDNSTLETLKGKAKHVRNL